MNASQGEDRESPRNRVNRNDYCRPVGDRLKVLFADLARDPMPDRMRQLAEALEDAMQRGELGRPKHS